MRLTHAEAGLQFGQHEVVEVLLAAGAGTEMVDAVEITPLQYAAEAGHAPTVELLLAAGAQVRCHWHIQVNSRPHVLTKLIRGFRGTMYQCAVKGVKGFNGRFE